MRHYCTYFDHNYLPRGLALYQSLRRQGGEFRLWVLCLSDLCFEKLTRLALAGIEPIRLRDFEEGDAPLLEARKNRSLIEYYFTCSPSLPSFVFRKAADADAVTYLDGDLYFFDDPELAHAEAAGFSIAITPHRFAPSLSDRVQFGIYNVGWLTFKRDEAAFACLKWWRERCLEWCYDRCEPTRFADQKYLDDWPVRFPNVKVLNHPGINLAPWNMGNHRVETAGGKVIVDGQPLIFFHFHALKQLTPSVFDPRWRQYSVNAGDVVRNQIYRPYLQELVALTAANSDSSQVTADIRKNPGGSATPTSFGKRLKARWDLWRGLLKGRYLSVPRPSGMNPGFNPADRSPA